MSGDSDELAARRHRKRERGELARLREADEAMRMDGACNGECAQEDPADPRGHTRGGVKTGKQLANGQPQRTQGFVAATLPAGHALNPYDWPYLVVRPCYDCNRARWEAWQAGTMR